ncbi:MAG: class III signal peptide-containing protein [archaeon]
MNVKGQGAIEYLLLLAAGVVVVAIVISFMIGTIGPVTQSGSQQTYDYTCKTMNTNSFTCGCYLCDASKSGYDDVTKTIQTPDVSKCEALSNLKQEPLLGGLKCPAGSLPNTR